MAVATTDALGSVTGYTYDEMDRMTSVQGLDGETTSYLYDANGRRTKTSNRTLTTEYAYDEVGNLVKQQTTGKTELSLEYVYDRNNAMMSETRVEKGSSVKTEYTYDQLGQLTSLVKSSGHSEAFAYDKVGNMVSKEFNDAKITMTYDAANELRTMESVSGKIDYSYDANGNLTSKTLGNKVDTYTYDTYNQLTSYKGYDGYQQRYTYNAQGHMIRKETKGNENRLTLEEIVRGEGEKQAATGDGEEDDPDPDPYTGQATSNSWQADPTGGSEGWQATTYIYDVTRQYYEVLSETTDGATTTYDYGIERLSAYSGNTWNARKTEYVYDGRGSVVQGINYNNAWYTLKGRIGKAEVTSYSYSAFGELLQNESSGFRFNGEHYDSATGMINLRARRFEPAIGRFEQRDRWAGYATFTLSQNRYTYCVNDPINLADRGGDRYDEGGVSVASNVSKGMSVAQAVAKSAANQANVQAIYNANVKTTSSKSNGYVSVADLRIDYYKDKQVPDTKPKETYDDGSVWRFLKVDALDLLDKEFEEWKSKNKSYNAADVNAVYKNAVENMNALYNSNISFGTTTAWRVIEGMILILSQIVDKNKKLSQYSTSELAKLQKDIAFEGLGLERLKEICSEIVNTDKPVGSRNSYLDLEKNNKTSGLVFINVLGTKLPYFKAEEGKVSIKLEATQILGSSALANFEITLFDSNGQVVGSPQRLSNGIADFNITNDGLYYAQIAQVSKEAGHASFIYSYEASISKE